MFSGHLNIIKSLPYNKTWKTNLIKYIFIDFIHSRDAATARYQWRKAA